MDISINQIQKEFILKAIWNISILYDFDNLSDTEFLNTYSISKSDLKYFTNILSEDLRQ